MNQNLFRIVFNAARGQVMAVSEVASACGKSASGETRASRVNSGSNQALSHLLPAQAAIKSIVSSIASVCAVWAFASAFSPVHAQIVADTTAAGNLRPLVTTTANGVPQVNIQTPSAAGVSRNVYSQFDVKANGAVLNNSSANVQTQLGGWVQGNSNLAAGNARVILNEVNSSNPSQLNGFVEVAGQRAEVIIANPAGIAVNGGGFINASGVTLTTGTPTLNPLTGGSLDGYRVQRGSISFSGAGLDAGSADYTNIIARAVQVNAGIWANNLKVTTGANEVNAANTSATAIAGTGTAPAFALDVAAIGGMYAGKITLIGTEAGLGVNNAGTLAASSGDLVLSSNGMLTNTGTIDSQGATVLKATTVNNTATGQIYGNSVAIGANTLNNAPATVGGTAPVIAARTARMDIGVATLNNQEGAVIYSQGDMAIGGSLGENNQVNNAVGGRATRITNNSATIESMGSIDIKTVDLSNTYDRLSYRVQANASTSGSVGCGDNCYSDYTQTTYTALPVDTATGPAKILSAHTITLNATGTARNQSSQILAGDLLDITGNNVSNVGIDVALNTEQRGTTYQRRTERYWDWGWKERAWWEPSAYANDIPVSQTVTPGTAPAQASNPNSGRTAPSSTTLPTSSQYRINNALGAAYLVETNARFTNMQAWLGSDYMLASVMLDPSVTQKRLGDGFYEQRLINEQVAQLTGRRFFANYTSDEQQYQALMDAGITYAQAFNLRPGIALSAAQVAQLTSDIVWLVEKEVTLQDGSKQRALVPQVYTKVREGDLASTGALLSGNTVNIALQTNGPVGSGAITNTGTILGRQLVQINAQSVNNLGGGLIQANTVNANASQDINNIGGSISAQNALQVTAARNLNVQSSTAQTTNDTGRVKTSNQAITRVGSLSVTQAGGTLLASAGNDANLIGAAIQSAGNATISAGNNVNLQTVATGNSFDATIDSGNFNRNSQSAEVGTSIQSAGKTEITAGNTIAARAAQVQAKGDLIATAGNSVTIEAGQASRSESSGRTTAGNSFFASSTTTERNASSSTQAVGSDLGGRSVMVTSGNNIRIKASNVLADKDVTLAAANNITIEAGTNTQSRSSFSAKSESGLMTNGGLSISVGEREQSTDQKNTSTSAAASTVGSVGGNVNITTGKQYTQTGSDVLAPVGDVNITAQKVDIVEARETSASQTESKFKQSGITVAVQSSALQAAQTVQAMDKASQNTRNDRMKALGAASAALAISQAASKPASLSMSIGSSESQSSTSSTSSTARASNINAAGNVNISATGAGQDSNVRIQGSTVKAGDTATLTADNKVNLLAAANTASQTSSQSSSSASVGVDTNFNVTLSANQGSGDGNGQDISYTNARIDATNQVNIQSGGDTTLKGAVVKANTVKAQVGGNLHVESLQDQSNYTEQSHSEGGSLSVNVTGVPTGASVNGGKPILTATMRLLPNKAA